MLKQMESPCKKCSDRDEEEILKRQKTVDTISQCNGCKDLNNEIEIKEKSITAAL